MLSRPPGRSHALALGLALAVAAALLTARAGIGWIPHDEGLMGQMAERVLQGELPHRDFDATYTGGTELLHALSFKLFGIDLRALRTTLLLFALAFTAALYFLASRFASPWLSAALAVTSVAWSVAGYFAPLPSWYLLFFWIFGACCLLRYASTRRIAWLVGAGACGAFAFLAKTTGLLFFDVAALFLVFDAQPQCPPGATRARMTLPGLPVCAGLVAQLAACILLVHAHLGAMEALTFVAPLASLTILLLALAIRAPLDGPGGRALIARLAALALGAAIPVGLFLIPFARSGALGAFWTGVFVLPQRRISSVVWPLPPLGTVLFALLLAAPLLAPALSRRLPARWVAAATCLAGLVLLAFGSVPGIYRGIWYSVRSLAPLAVAAGSLALWRWPPAEKQVRDAGFAILACASLIGLLQYPYAFAIYFLYTAPLVLLAVAWTAGQRRGGAPAAFGLPALGVYAAFAVLWLHPGSPRYFGARFVERGALEPLKLDRAGIAVPREDASVYEGLVAAIEEHSAPGDFVYATPDCPEVYFLSGRRNPTRTLYELFDADADQAPEARRDRILQTLEEKRVRVVVLARDAEFSGEPSVELARALVERFPGSGQWGRFTVRWRE